MKGMGIMDSSIQAEKKAWVAPTLAIVDVRETLGGPFNQATEGAFVFQGLPTSLQGGPNGSLIVVRQ